MWLGKINKPQGTKPPAYFYEVTVKFSWERGVGSFGWQLAVFRQSIFSRRYKDKR